MQQPVTPTAVVVDDSLFMRTVIGDILESGGIEVVASVGSGDDAVRAVDEFAPDVVTMDVEMPGIDGVEAVTRIMETRPTPILMLSAHTDGHASVTFEAIERGAVDFFTKPGGEVSTAMGRFETQLVEQVRAVAASSIGARPEPLEPSVRGVSTDDLVSNPTLVVGASTGGPHAVEQLLAALPLAADFRVVVVQHMPAGFTERFADRLDGASAYRVREADDGTTIGGGEAVVAPGGTHTIVAGYRDGRLRFQLDRSDRVHGVRPAIDLTMESAAAVVDDPLVAVILTGMGSDGAAGVRHVKAAGGVTIAQDEATSAVFGMPRRAIETGCVDAVLPISDIPGAVVERMRRGATA